MCEVHDLQQYETMPRYRYGATVYIGIEEVLGMVFFRRTTVVWRPCSYRDYGGTDLALRFVWELVWCRHVYRN